MKRYSQYDEQEHILRAFGYVRTEVGDVIGEHLSTPNAGRFLDVGAYNPFEFSNTRALYELGWSGVMVEPSPGPMTSLVREYGNDPRITLIQAVVGMPGRDGLISMHVTDDCVSTVVEKEFERWRRQAQFLGSIMIPIIQLSRIGDQFGAFDFVNFDVEGSSAFLFLFAVQGLMWRPRCVCVEFDGNKQETETGAAIAGYRPVYSNETNIVFVRQG